MRCADCSNGVGLYAHCVSNHPPRQVHVAYLINPISYWQTAVPFLIISRFFREHHSLCEWRLSGVLKHLRKYER